MTLRPSVNPQARQGPCRSQRDSQAPRLAVSLGKANSFASLGSAMSPHSDVPGGGGNRPCGAAYLITKGKGGKGSFPPLARRASQGGQTRPGTC